MKTQRTKPERQTVGIPAVSGTAHHRIRNAVGTLSAPRRARLCKVSTGLRTPLLALLAFCLLPAAFSRAQTPDDFNPGADPALVYSFAVQPDGKIVVGGYFTNLAGQSRSSIGRLNADGTPDTEFNANADVRGLVFSTALQADGKILVRGSARLNTDGTPDTGFSPENYSVDNSLALQSDGKIVAGGYRIVRLNPDGTLDAGFNPVVGGEDHDVYALAIQPDGKIVAGGEFSSVNGQLRHNIARLNADGTLDLDFDPGGIFGGDVVSLAVQADGKILVAGNFATVAGQTRIGIARLQANGTLEQAFNPGANGEVGSLALQADGKILLGGRFTVVGGQPRNGIARLNPDGTLDQGFDPAPGAEGGRFNGLYSVAVQPDGKILVGGDFTMLGGQPRLNIGRLNNNTPATERLGSDSSTVVWQRGGSSPEVWHTTFEHSTNGMDWTYLGAGSRIPGGWQLGGLSLPSVGTIRARGQVAGGHNTSGWFVETTAPVGVPPFGTLHVWQDSPNPIPPYTNWTTAAHTIQDAVDAAQSGDTVLVTNGVYATGGRAVVGTMTNRLVIDKAITVKSVNGPEATLIVGAPAPGGTNGAGAIRCVYLGHNAVLSGYTLTNGHTLWRSGASHTEARGGGAWCEPSGVLTNCLIVGCSAADDGGGIYQGNLYDCKLVWNEALKDGGAADHGALYRCVLADNLGRKGAAADDSTLYNCVITRNRTSDEGGAVARSELYNCTLTENSGGERGGAAWESTLSNCTVTHNSGRQGGGVEGCILYNCIVYHNRAPIGSNHFNSEFHFSCTSPLPDHGEGNIAADPQLASATHLSANSPCRAGGAAIYVEGVDIDGEAWGTPPSMGADELVAGGATSPLVVTAQASFTNIAVGFGVTFEAHIEGQTTGARWTFGDGTALSNQVEALHAWTVPGFYPVQLTAFNDAHPSGIAATVSVQVVGRPLFYVKHDNPTPAFPYTTWDSAATTIQEAIGASQVAGRVVWVTNGVYETGGVAVWGTMTNRVALVDGVVVRSVNGPAETLILGAPASNGTNGYGAIRCAYVGDYGILDGFTLSHGCTQVSGDTSRDQGGGGAWSERTGMLTNCALIWNSAHRDGGGVHGGRLYRCRIAGNVANDDGGGADEAVVYNSLLIGNQAAHAGGGASESVLFNSLIASNRARDFGGGVELGTLVNCTVTGNSAPSAFQGGGVATSDGPVVLFNCIVYDNVPNNYGELQGSVHAPSFSYCCTTPLPVDGHGNVANSPRLLVDSAGNTRLQPDSPCINAGNNAYTFGEADLDGLPRIAGGTVDIGAYEFQTPASLLSYAWLQQYGLPTDGSVDFADSDNDRLNNWQEWRCGTDPTSALSVLRLLTPLPAANNVNVNWQSVAGVSYFLERSTNLAASPPFQPLATNLVGQASTTTFTDTNISATIPAFYRVGVRN